MYVHVSLFMLIWLHLTSWRYVYIPRIPTRRGVFSSPGFSILIGCLHSNLGKYILLHYHHYLFLPIACMPTFPFASGTQLPEANFSLPTGNSWFTKLPATNMLFPFWRCTAKLWARISQWLLTFLKPMCRQPSIDVCQNSWSSANVQSDSNV